MSWKMLFGITLLAFSALALAVKFDHVRKIAAAPTVIAPTAQQTLPPIVVPAAPKLTEAQMLGMSEAEYSRLQHQPKPQADSVQLPPRIEYDADPQASERAKERARQFEADTARAAAIADEHDLQRRERYAQKLEGWKREEIAAARAQREAEERAVKAQQWELNRLRMQRIQRDLETPQGTRCNSVENGNGVSTTCEPSNQMVY